MYNYSAEFPLHHFITNNGLSNGLSNQKISDLIELIYD